MTTHTHIRTCPTRPRAPQVLLQGWVHRRRELAKVTFLVVRDRTGLAQVVLPAGSRPAAGGDAGRGDRDGDRQRAGARRGRGDRGDRDRADRAGRDPGRRAVATRRSTPGCRRCSTTPPTTWRHPLQRAKWELAAASLRGFRDTLDARGFTEVQLPQAGRVRDRERRQRLRGRLLRPPGVPRPEPAVLQAAAGRGLRARLRGRAGVPRRAARHGAAPRGVRLARRRARLHRGPPRRRRLSARRGRRHGRRGPRARRAGRRAARHRAAAWCPRSSRSLHFREALADRRRTGRRARPRPGARARAGRVGEAEHGSDFVVVEGYPTAQPRVLQPPRPGRPALVAVAST